MSRLDLEFRLRTFKTDPDWRSSRTFWQVKSFKVHLDITRAWQWRPRVVFPYFLFLVLDHKRQCDLSITLNTSCEPFKRTTLNFTFSNYYFNLLFTNLISWTNDADHSMNRNLGNTVCHCGTMTEWRLLNVITLDKCLQDIELMESKLEVDIISIE